MVETCHGTVSRSGLVAVPVALPGYIPPRLTISHDQFGCVYIEFPLCGGCVGGWILVLMKAREQTVAKRSACRCCASRPVITPLRTSIRTRNCPGYLRSDCTHRGFSSTEVSRGLGIATRFHRGESVIMNIICITSGDGSFFKPTSLKCQD